ncbi:MAG: DNA repair protein RecO [Betaproteobacteria bacterium]|nr:DNA repair protein RecO [Betaproteobacteria bacterium]
MPRSPLAQRRDNQPAFVLHTYPYRETSLIVEALSSAHGRIGLVARGAKRPRSELRGLLQAFQPLTLAWAGTGELKTLTKAEWRGGVPRPGGAALLCGFYLNELLLKMLAREDPHPKLFGDYEAALGALAAETSAASQAGILRRFELRLLAELGYALPLKYESESGDPIDATSRYHYLFDRGPRLIETNVAREPGLRWPVVRGATLLALSSQTFADAEVASEAKHLMRQVLDHYLEERRIFSRRIVQDLQALDEQIEPQKMTDG